MMSLSGFEGQNSNQNLKRTGATRLFQKGFEEDVVSKHTGHRSNAVRIYKEESSEQKEIASKCLYGMKTNIKSVSDESISSFFSGTFNSCSFNVTLSKDA